MDAVSLPLAEEKQRWTEDEYKVFEYVMTGKLKWTPSTKGSITWSLVEYQFRKVARVAKLNDKFAAVYSRTAAQLEGKWKKGYKERITSLFHMRFIS